jgi:hypothetical protein
MSHEWSGEKALGDDINTDGVKAVTRTRSLKTVLRERLLSAWKSSGRITRVVTRPQSMSAYATLAAALAAFLSLRVAERQERASFTSMLFNKQVDVLSQFETKYDSFLINVYDYREAVANRNAKKSYQTKVDVPADTTEDLAIQNYMMRFSQLI